MSEVTEVEKICERFGYGRVMQIASESWQEKASSEGTPGEGLVIGPHAVMVVACGCNPEYSCQWCCGAGWLTKHVKSLKGAELEIGK